MKIAWNNVGLIRKVPELAGLGITLSCFAYTGALDANMAASMIVTALA